MSNYFLTHVLTHLFSFLVSGLEMINCLYFLELSGLCEASGYVLASMTSVQNIDFFLPK